MDATGAYYSSRVNIKSDGLHPKGFHESTESIWSSVSSNKPSSVLATSSFLLYIVVRPGAPSSVLAPSSDARSP